MWSGNRGFHALHGWMRCCADRIATDYDDPAGPLGSERDCRIRRLLFDAPVRRAHRSKHLLRVAMAKTRDRVARVVTAKGFSPVAAGTHVTLGQDPGAGLQVRAGIECDLIRI